jgi:hypothetical protein
MKKLLTAVTAVTFLGSVAVWAGETAGEKLDNTVNSAKSTGKKAMNRTSESLCTGSKTECEQQKAKNHMNEAKDSAANKANETQEKLE